MVNDESNKYRKEIRLDVDFGWDSAKRSQAVNNCSIIIRQRVVVNEENYENDYELFSFFFLHFNVYIISK